jgi:hypothetical protein
MIDTGRHCERRRSNPNSTIGKPLDFQIFPKFLQDFYWTRICNINNLRLIKGGFASLGFAGWQVSGILEPDRRPWRQRFIHGMAAIRRERNCALPSFRKK